MNAHSAPPLDRTQPRDAETAPWQPRTLCDLLALPVINACSVRRAVFRGSVEGLPVELDLSPTCAMEPVATATDHVEIIWSCGEASAKATVAYTAVRRLLDRMQPELADDPPTDPTLSLLVELALAPLLAKIEASIGEVLAIRASSRRASEDLARRDTRSIWLSFHGTLDGVPFKVVLEFDGRDPHALESLLTLLQHAPPVRLPLAETFAPVALIVDVGALRLSMRTLQSLRTGDVLIPDEFPLERGELAITIGHRYRATTRVDGNGVRVQSPLRRCKSIEETNAMDSTGTPRIVDAEGLGDLEIQLAFELGRQTVELDQLRAIAPGYVFALGRSPDDPVDIVANGRRIGRGEIVRVGDGLGVRIIRLFDHG